jgi:hypothetical protein
VSALNGRETPGDIIGRKLVMRMTVSAAALAALFVSTVGVASGQAQDDQVVIGYSAPGLVGAQAQIQAGLVNGAKAK